MKYKIEIDVPDAFEPQAIYKIDNNGCCEKDYFVLTTNKRSDGVTNYSCQCGCGGWVTTGFTTAQGAIGNYRGMCKKYQNQLRREKTL